MSYFYLIDIYFRKLWCLDVCSMLLPSISNLIQSGNEVYVLYLINLNIKNLNFCLELCNNNEHEKKVF